MPVNRFVLKKALADLDAKGIQVGDSVTVSWDVDAAYGGAMRSHTGTLTWLDRKDGWFQVSGTNRSPGYLRSSILSSSLTITKAAKKRNPFIEKARNA